MLRLNSIARFAAAGSGIGRQKETAMTDAIQELRVRAEILHSRIEAGDERAVVRLRVLPQYRRSKEDDLAAIAQKIRRQDCLTIMAAELGFANWPEAKRVLAGEDNDTDFGTLLCPKRCCGHLNRWYKHYDEAAAMRETCDGYLLAYRRQYLVVDRYYIESLGLDPDDSDWEALGFDWVRPRSNAARARLYGKLVAALPRELRD
jgi:hypothetical protein